MGYEFVGDGTYVSSDSFDFPFFFTEFASEPLYPDFDPSLLPWNDMPSYIQDIVFYGLDELVGVDNPKVPFVLVTFNGKNALLYIGFNLSLGYSIDYGGVRVWGAPKESSSSLHRCCYGATYTLQSDGSYILTSPWSARSPVDYGNAGRLQYYSTNFINVTNYDFYVYGANFIKASTSGFYSSVNISADSDNGNVISFMQSINGFESGNYFSSSALITSYWDYFVPSKYGSGFDDSFYDDYKSAEDELLTGYNSADFLNDFNVALDNSSSEFIFNLLTTTVFSNQYVSMAFLSILCLGIIALLFNR